MSTLQLHNISEISAETLTDPAVTPEKLAILKLRGSVHNGDMSSEHGKHSRSRRGSISSSNGEAGHSATSSRHVTAIMRRRSSSRAMGSHFSADTKMSSERTRQAEGKFFALMDFVSSASREASSLKEFWSELIKERDSLSREREELMEQITEITETLDSKESEHHHHSHELGERKKQIETLLAELSIALSTIAEHKKYRTDHEHELSRSRHELQTLRDSFSRITITHEKLKAGFEAVELRLKTCEEERDHAKRHGDKYHEELRTLTREHQELESRSVETTLKLEKTRKEILSLTDRIKISEMERDDYLLEVERLQGLLRKSNVKNEEISTELFEITEKHTHQSREIIKFKETIQELESEVDKSRSTVEHLRREIKIKSTAVEEVEAQLVEINLKFEHFKREHLLTKEKLSSLELERTELLELIEKSREESRLSIIERTQLKDDVEMWRHRSGDNQRLVANLQETLRKTELTLSEVQLEVLSFTERLSQAESERDEARDKNHHHGLEITQLKEKLLIVAAEIRTISEARDRHRDEAHEHKARFEEITETITEFEESTSGYEFEIDNLRSMLRESREEKERAIAARHAADRERDEYIARYEEKCREMERFEQTAASVFHASAKSEGGRMTSRTVTRTVSNGIESSEHEHTHHHQD